MEQIKRTKIADIFNPELLNTTVCVKGWVRTKRGNKNVAFIALNDGSCVANIQIVVDLASFDEEKLKAVTTGACIRVDGKLVESPASGGSLATADIADSYGRTVMAVPGRITDASSFGSNNLIRTGKARMILTASDIVEEMGWDTTQPSTEDPVGTSYDDVTDSERAILEALDSSSSLDWDSLVAISGLTMGELAMTLMDLELKRAIRCLPNKRYERI